MPLPASKKIIVGTVIFLTVALLLVGAYVFHAFYLFYQFSKVSETTVAEQVNWASSRLSDEKYTIVATYTYSLSGKTYQGKTDFSNTHYRNPYGAEQAIKENEGKMWVVWYNPNDPAFSTLDHRFPMKETIYATILFFLLYYFIWGGQYVLRRMSQRLK